jgi:hypothetical protein
MLSWCVHFPTVWISKQALAHSMTKVIVSSAENFFVQNMAPEQQRASEVHEISNII